MHGVVVGNEVLDAMPVQLLARSGGAWFERGVVRRGEGFAWEDRPTELRPPVDIEGAHDYLTEIHPQAQAFIATLADRLQAGAAFFIDYGFPEAEYYHPQRHMGTVMCHRGHQADGDPLADVGAKDITAHVDFTGVALAGQEAGFEVLGYASQARFLLNCGILPMMEQASLAERTLAAQPDPRARDGRAVQGHRLRRRRGLGRGRVHRGRPQPHALRGSADSSRMGRMTAAPTTDSAPHQDFEVRPFDAPVGAEIVGLDIARPIDEADFARIHRAHLDHHVLVFRDQPITPDQHIAFSRRFGPLQIHVLHQFQLEGHPEILIVSNIKKADGKPIGLGDAGAYWHSDLSYKPHPSLGSLLHAQELPSEGGDTLFADQHLAWEGLVRRCSGASCR